MGEVEQRVDITIGGRMIESLDKNKVKLKIEKKNNDLDLEIEMKLKTYQIEI